MLHAAWNSDSGFLPASLRTRLLMGSVGSRPLMDMALAALQPSAKGKGQSPELADAARHMLLAAWEDDPLHGELAAQAATLVARAAPDDPVLPVLNRLATTWRRPQDLRYFERIAGNLEFDKLHAFLDRQAEKDPDNLFWLNQAWAVAEVDGDLPRLAERIERFRPRDARLDPLKAFVAANLAFLQQDWSAALNLYAGASLDGSLWLKPLERRAECLYCLGEQDAALGLWARVLEARPWHASLALHAHDLLAGRNRPATALPGKTAALLYTFNKAPDLNVALESLAQSTGWDLLIALDNGSTDATAQVLAAWRERLGAERMSIVSLPVNVGAPAARNWLKSLDALKETDFAAYLDDDAVLPPDWVGRLATAQAAYPRAGVWGCRIVDAQAPFITQCADQHLTLAGEFQDPANSPPPLEPPPASQLKAMPFAVSALPGLTPGYGLFAYLRPCAAVTGCCHLFATRDLLAGPDFAISLSPSQYDDLEHDLRLNLGGRSACYQGFLSVSHLKRSGKAVRADPAQLGSGLANRYKMYRLFTPAELSAITEFSRRTVLEDFLHKLPLIEAGLGQARGSTSATRTP